MTPGTCHVAAEDALNGPLAVACVTTDFAVQNVLLQVRLSVANVSLSRCIRSVYGRTGRLDYPPAQLAHLSLPPP